MALRAAPYSLVGIGAQAAADPSPASNSAIVKELVLFRSILPAGALVSSALMICVLALIERRLAGLPLLQSRSALRCSQAAP